MKNVGTELNKVMGKVAKHCTGITGFPVLVLLIPDWEQEFCDLVLISNFFGMCLC